MTSADRADYLPRGAEGYFAGGSPEPRARILVTFAPGAPVAVQAQSTVDPTMLPGKAYEEMTVKQLRGIAARRGIPASGLSKPSLIRKLRA